MKRHLIFLAILTFVFYSCQNKSVETHYADKDYSYGTGLETFDQSLAESIDKINRHNPFKTEVGFILNQVKMEDESIIYIIELDDGVSAKDVDWSNLDKRTKEGMWEFLGEHSQRVKFFTQCALSGRYIICEYYAGTEKIHTVKVWPGDYIEDQVYY